MTNFSPVVGMKGRAEWIVSAQHLADAVGNAGVKVLSTPMLLDLMEIAAGDALAAAMPPDWVSLGISVNLKHLRLTPEHFHVHAKATIVGIDRQKVDFWIQVYDDLELVGEAAHSRFCLPKAELEQRISSKTARRIDR